MPSGIPQASRYQSRLPALRLGNLLMIVHSFHFKEIPASHSKWATWRATVTEISIFCVVEPLLAADTVTE